MAKTLYLTFDLEEWPWPYILQLKICSLVRCTCTPNIKCLPIGSNAMAKVKVDFFTYIFDLWPLRMTLTLTNYPSKCAAWADAYACQISSFICYGQKVMVNVKVVLKQTDRQTNRQDKTKYAPQIWSGGHKKGWQKLLPSLKMHSLYMLILKSMAASLGCCNCYHYVNWKFFPRYP